MIKQIFNFNGVAKRQEYWAVHIAAFVSLVIGIALSNSNDIIALMISALMISALWAILATTARRLRDVNLNLAWMFVLLVPYVSTVATIVFGVLPTKEAE